jgi:transcriptional regulator with XRE-family HTH domain
MKIQVKIGKRIKELRDKKKLTQEELAKKSKLNRTFIIHVEKGRRNLSVQSLESILKGLKIPFRKFFKKDIF